MEDQKRIEELLGELDLSQRVLYLAACAEHALEGVTRAEGRAFEALRAVRMWACGFMKPSEVRPLAFAAHGAAKQAEGQPQSYAARSAAHAASAVFSLSHIPICLEYARKASQEPSRETSWQLETLQKRIKNLSRN